MDFSFFESLSKQEAEAFLKNYLGVESKAVLEMIAAIEKDNILADFSIQSIPGVLKWLFDKIKTIPKQVDETLPKWIRECDSYLNGLFDFDEPSKVLILRASYYWGECFVRYSDILSWTIGNSETAEQNMPVVAGFVDEIEMAPLLIVENLFLRILADGAPYEDINRAIESWLSDIPKTKRKS
jgi:hypothetical protein